MDDGYFDIMEELKHSSCTDHLLRRVYHSSISFRQIRYKIIFKIRDKLIIDIELGYLKLVLIELYF